MMHLQLKKRGTGRTTRMLADAVERAKAGQPVLVICSTPEDVKACIQQVKAGERIRRVYDNSLHFTDGGAIVFRTPEFIYFRSLYAKDGQRDWIVLIDHAAIEHNYAPMLEMLTRYDA